MRAGIHSVDVGLDDPKRLITLALHGSVFVMHANSTPPWALGSVASIIGQRLSQSYSTVPTLGHRR